MYYFLFEAVNFICDHPDIRAISFVGSNQAGEYIYERGSRNGKRVQANMVMPLKAACNTTQTASICVCLNRPQCSAVDADFATYSYLMRLTFLPACWQQSHNYYTMLLPER